MTTLNLENFGKRIKKLIEETGLTQTSFALNLGITQSKLSCWIRHKITPETHSLISACKTLNCSIDYLLGLSENSQIEIPKNSENFSARLKFLVKKRGVSGLEICRELNLNPSSFNRWINQISLPHLHNLFQLTKYFNCSADYILGLKN